MALRKALNIFLMWKELLLMQWLPLIFHISFLLGQLVKGTDELLRGSSWGHLVSLEERRQRGDPISACTFLKGGSRMGGGLLSLVTRNGTWGNGIKLESIRGSSDEALGRGSSLRGWLITGTGFAEKWSQRQSWQGSASLCMMHLEGLVVGSLEGVNEPHWAPSSFLIFCPAQSVCVLRRLSNNVRCRKGFM